MANSNVNDEFQERHSQQVGHVRLDGTVIYSHEGRSRPVKLALPDTGFIVQQLGISTALRWAGQSVAQPDSKVGEGSKRGSISRARQVSGASAASAAAY